MISYLLVVEQHRTQIVIHALLKCQQENLYHEQNVTHIDRKSGSAGMPRPISYAVFCLKKKTNDDQAAKLPVITHVLNDNGGTAVADHSTLDTVGTNDDPCSPSSADNS